jgi:tetratricopeptide (TPR) repeat protein
MMAIVKRLLPERILDNPHDAVTLVKDVLSGWSDPWLLVFDNLDNPSDFHYIIAFSQDSRWGCILVTSRFAGAKELGWVIGLDRMEKDEGLQLLLWGSQADTELAAAEELLMKLGYLPLAIDQARAYISGRQLRLVDFVSEFNIRKQTIMEETPRLWQYRRAYPDLEEPTSLSLLTTWEMSLALLDVGEEHKTELQNILTLFAFFHPVTISETLFSGADLATSPMTVCRNNGRWNRMKFERVVVRLQEQSLIQFAHRNPNEIVVSLHSMVSEWLRMRLDKDLLSTFLKTATSHLRNYLNSTARNDHSIRQEALSHIDSICQMEEFHIENDGSSEACSAFGNFYADQGRLDDAERMYNRALAGKEKAWGPEHTSTLDTVNNLGLLYADQGCLDDAERMYNRALAGFEKAWGPEHTSTLDTVNNLGLLYADRGCLDDAERMYNRALAGKEKAWGPEHTSTLSTVNNLGSLYKVQGRLDDAERMYNRALTEKEKAWGPEHIHA